ncbi:MAG: hypothetical protein K2X27_27850 [Candidatus Obscuribacterales bacterium]|nr:hypothetical protein [Candidatus Obscuribacterales bacterium]
MNTLSRSNTFLQRQIGPAPELELEYAECKQREAESKQVHNETSHRKSPYLISETIDLLFIAGLAPWILGLLAFLIIGDPQLSNSKADQLGLAIPYTVASLLIGEGHQFTSIIRYYRKKRTKRFLLKRLPFWIIYAGMALVALLMLFSQIPEPLRTELGKMEALNSFAKVSGGGLSIAAMILGVVFGLGFPTILMQHFCAQAKSIGLFYCAKQSFELSKSEKLVLNLCSLTLTIAGAFTIALPFGFGLDSNFLLRTPLADPGNTWMLAAFHFWESFAIYPALAMLTLFSAMILRRGIKTGEWLPFGAGLLWLNLSIWVLMPLQQILFVWLFVPVFYHATQHWAIAWISRKKELAAEGKTLESETDKLLEFSKMTIPVFCLTLSILFMPLLLAKIGINVESIFGSNGGTLNVFWSMLVFYMHYFSDRIVWRQN